MKCQRSPALPLLLAASSVVCAMDGPSDGWSMPFSPRLFLPKYILLLLVVVCSGGGYLAC